MARRIGESFGAELQALGLDAVAVSWTDDGALMFGAGVPLEQRGAVEAALEAHDPEAKPVELEIKEEMRAAPDLDAWSLLELLYDAGIVTDQHLTRASAAVRQVLARRRQIRAGARGAP